MNDNVFDINKKPDDYYSSRNEMLRFIPPDISKVLDVGCGEGHFGQVLKSKYSVEVWGIEVFEDAAENAKTRLDKVLIGNIENGEIILPKNYFDCIIFNDVLEHLHYPWIVLRDIKSSLKKNGTIVSSIPNVRFYRNIKNLLINKKWDYVDDGILDKTHLRFFTYKSIQEMFKICGYRVINIKGIKDRCFEWEFRLLNKILFNSLNDMRYMQFVCVAIKEDG